MIHWAYILLLHASVVYGRNSHTASKEANYLLCPVSSSSRRYVSRKASKLAGSTHEPESLYVHLRNRRWRADLRRAGANLLFLIQKMGTDAERMPISARNESGGNLFSCA